jgi:hypothetical protein
MNPNTLITSKKYKTIGNLLKAPIKSINVVASNELDENIRYYLYEWLWINHYSKKKMDGNLTMRIRMISNKPCYWYIMNHCFNKIDVLEQNTHITILNNDCTQFIHSLHLIEPSLTGNFFDYLIRRFICDITNKPFYDSRAECECRGERISIGINDKKFMFDALPTSMYNSYQKTKNTSVYKTETILSEIFITSLSHTFAFCGIPSNDKINDLLVIIKNINIYVINSLKQFCIDLIKKRNDIELNPSLGHQIPLLNNARIPADCDIIINETLYDIKCTVGNNNIYEILQLLGYASLKSSFNYPLRKKINTISIINLLQGYIINYNISNITSEHMIDYLKILM